MNNCKTGVSNRYRYARLRAAKGNSQLTSMELASEQLFISRRTLWDIENDVNVPSTTLVRQMAQVYRTPELMHNYCQSQCEIGKALNVRPLTGLNSEQIALHVICLATTANQIARNLAESICKGDMAGTAVQSFIVWSGDIAQLGRELTIIIEKGGQHASL